MSNKKREIVESVSSMMQNCAMNAIDSNDEGIISELHEAANDDENGVGKIEVIVSERLCVDENGVYSVDTKVDYSRKIVHKDSLMTAKFDPAQPDLPFDGDEDDAFEDGTEGGEQ